MTANTNANEGLDIATLPLSDGRYVAIPLLALAEVQQLPAAEDGEDGMGTIHWRGHDLPIASLDEFFGLQAQPREKHITVGILRGGNDSKDQFRALAFCGLAAHQRISAEEMKSAETPEGGRFKAAAKVEGKTFLVPDLEKLLYSTTRGGKGRKR